MFAEATSKTWSYVSKEKLNELYTETLTALVIFSQYPFQSISSCTFFLISIPKVRGFMIGMSVISVFLIFSILFFYNTNWFRNRKIDLYLLIFGLSLICFKIGVLNGILAVKTSILAESYRQITDNIHLFQLSSFIDFYFICYLIVRYGKDMLVNFQLKYIPNVLLRVTSFFLFFGLFNSVFTEQCLPEVLHPFINEWLVFVQILLSFLCVFLFFRDFSGVGFVYGHKKFFKAIEKESTVEEEQIEQPVEES